MLKYFWGVVPIGRTAFIVRVVLWFVVLSLTSYYANTFNAYNWPIFLVFVTMFWFLYAGIITRLRDLNKPWWNAVVYSPFSILFIIYLCCAPSKHVDA